MTERTTVRLPDDLMRRAKRKAAAENRSLTALIEDALRGILDTRATVPRASRVLPPVSKAGGGLVPGIDLNDTAGLQDLEDRDYMRRLR